MGRVIKVRPHPYGDRIWLADIEVGRLYQLQIVWGGVPIVKEGHLVPVAPPGSRLPQGKMRRRRYRGETSEGMLCSLRELGWDERVSDRVALLRDDLEPGESLDAYADAYPAVDWRSVLRDDQPPLNGAPPPAPDGWHLSVMAEPVA